mgnify:FL=1
MSNREIVLRLDERWYKALNRHLKNETLEEHMEDVLDELCNQLPQREYEHISREIWQEDQESRQARDTEQKIAVFHVTENGESVYFSVAEPMELLQTAVHLRNCLSDENADTKFTAMFPHKEKISQEQFDAAASERMENTGRVTGAYELDFDARTFSALNIIDGWKVYAMQDVADAARQAFQDAEVSEHERWCIFIDRLDGQELTTPSRLTVQNFYFEDSIEAMDDRILNFYVVPCFNVDEVFGTFVETDENDHALNIYANYDMQRQQVCDELEITLYGSGIDDQSLTYHLNAAEKEVLREKMEAYCMQREHMPLNQLCQEILQEQDAPTQEMQL